MSTNELTLPSNGSVTDEVEPAERTIPFHVPNISKEDIAAVAEALESGWLTQGPICAEFELAFADHVGAARAVSLASGTAALHLGLLALGVGPGDEVVTTPMTFCSCAHVIEHVGAKPVFADIDRATMQISPAGAERAMTGRTKAVIAVNYGGHPCEIEEIMEISRARSVAVIEDAAHSLGAAVGDRAVGAIADITTFSFYATKNITTGEGGMLTTEDPAIADRVERLRLHGMERDAWRRYGLNGTWYYDVAEAGFKANLTDFQAALGLSQLRREARIRARRAELASRYSEAFKTLNDLRGAPDSGRRCATRLASLPLRLAGPASCGRDQLVGDLKRRGISCSVHFIPIHLTSHFAKRYGYRGGEFPVSEDAYSRVLSLPMYAGMSDETVDYVANAIVEWVSHYAK